jgi:hypothetical protein
MSTTGALAAAGAAGVFITLDGADLVLEAGAAPPPAVLEGLKYHKPSIIALLRHSRPLPNSLLGISGRAWAGIAANLRCFEAEYGAKAAALGWSDLDLYAVHPKVGAARVDCCGALILARTPVVALEPSLIRYADGLVYRKAQFTEPVIPVWALRRQ